jgi:hypothetical protein
MAVARNSNYAELVDLGAFALDAAFRLRSNYNNQRAVDIR